MSFRNLVMETYLYDKGKGKAGIAVHGTPSHSNGVSLAIWDHTVLPATRHK